MMTTIATKIIDFFFPEKLAINGIHNGNRTEINRGAETKAPKYRIPPYPANEYNHKDLSFFQVLENKNRGKSNANTTANGRSQWVGIGEG